MDCQRPRARLAARDVGRPGFARALPAESGGIDTAGRRGSADYDVVAEPVTARGLTFSTMVLGVSYEHSFVPKLQFVREPTANGSFEILGAVPAGTLSVALELAANENGAALPCVPGRSWRRESPSAAGPTGVVPIGQLPPGDHVLRAVVSLDGQPIATLIRILRKSAA